MEINNSNSMEKPIGIMREDGKIELNNNGLKFVLKHIGKGETVTEKELLRRINKEIKKYHKKKNGKRNKTP